MPRSAGFRRLLVCNIVFAASVPQLAVRAEQPITGQGEWYYEIGGAEPVSPAPNAGVIPITIGGGASLTFGNACGDLDPVLSVSNLLDDVKNGIDQFEDAMVLAATSAISAHPAIIVQRANPGVYDHFQNALLSAQARVDVATRSCEEIVDAASRGQNPFEDWVRVSRSYSWSQEVDEPGNDPVTARDAVEAANGDNGVPWLEGDAGGLGQPPIRVIYDTIRAGYNVTVNRAPTDAGPPPASDPTPRVVDLWASPEAAGEWAVEVLGEDVIVTCRGCTPAVTPGHGLPPRYAEEKVALESDLTALVSGTVSPTLENLQAVSAPNVIVSRQLVEAVRNIPDAQERSLVIAKVASDVASARTVERALAIRRLVLTGQGVPEISANGLALENHEAALAEIEREIDNFLYEADVRKKLVSNTAMLVLQREQNRRTRSLQHPNTTARDSQPLLGGKVKPE